MAHYFDEEPQAGHQIRYVETRLGGHNFQFKTDQAVFSRNRLDCGSELLITTVAAEPVPPAGRMLDLGCGYGPVGIVMKRLFPALEVVLCDINARALALATENAAANQVRFLEIVQSDGLQALSGEYDLILTNPPIRAGKATVYRFFNESAEKLRPGGRLYVVIRKKQGAPSALDHLKCLFQMVDVIEKSGGFWIIRASQPVLTSDPPSQPILTNER